MVRQLLGFLLVLGLGCPTQGYQDGHFYGGLTVMGRNVLGVANDPDGSKSLFGEIYVPGLMFRGAVSVFGDNLLTPYIAVSQVPFLLDKETPEGGATVRVWQIGVPMTFPMNDTWSLSAGLGLLINNIKGKGGTKTLPNGTGTAEFGLPGRSVDSCLIYLDLGAGYEVNSFQMDLNLFTEGVLTSKRSFNLLFSVTYHLFGGSGGLF